jgi:hypothetical protein
MFHFEDFLDFLQSLCIFLWMVMQKKIHFEEKKLEISKREKKMFQMHIKIKNVFSRSEKKKFRYAAELISLHVCTKLYFILFYNCVKSRFTMQAFFFELKAQFNFNMQKIMR